VRRAIPRNPEQTGSCECVHGTGAKLAAGGCNSARWIAVAAVCTVLSINGCASLEALMGSPDDPADYGPVRPDNRKTADDVPDSTAAGALSALADAVYGRSETGVDEGPPEPPPDQPPASRVDDYQHEQPLVMALRDRGLDAHASPRGVVITLSDVMFEFGSADLTPEAKRKIQDISEVLEREGRGRAIAIEGHTDSIGAELFNQGLSDRRAGKVAQALEAAGVPDGLVSEKGFGSSFPIAPNSNPDGSDNPAGRARNRRVEVVVLN